MKLFPNLIIALFGCYLFTQLPSRPLSFMQSKPHCWIFTAPAPDKTGLTDCIGEQGQMLPRKQAEAHPFRGSALEARAEAEDRQAAYVQRYHETVTITPVQLPHL
jgi:hypothetical protein